MNKLPASTENLVREFRRRRRDYRALGKTLVPILENIAKPLCHDAIVSARAKTVGSLAEKILRKNNKYKQMEQITDLCGARVVVNLLSEVDAVGRTIRESFMVDEENSLDLLSKLRAAEFGYRSVHFVVSLRRDQHPGLPRKLYGLKAEIQVRTIAQHAWSAVGHDRIYKSPYPVPEPMLRDAARIAAQLESADGEFQQVVSRVEEYRSHFGVYLQGEKLTKEIELQDTLAKQDPKNPSAALRRAQLAMAKGDWTLAVRVLAGFKGTKTPAIKETHGYALCHWHEDAPNSPGFRQGQRLLREAAQENPADASAWVHLAETLRKADATKALECYRRALAADPTDPAALAGYLCLYLAVKRETEFLELLRPALATAIRRCEAQAAVGLELPWAYYRAAVLKLLSGPENLFGALDNLALAAICDQPQNAMEEALRAVSKLAARLPDRTDIAAAQRFLWLSLSVGFAHSGARRALRALATPRAKPVRGPVLIIAGSCDPQRPDAWSEWRHMLRVALTDFRGTIISGGTREGVSGLVGKLGQIYRGKIRTIGYLPANFQRSKTATRDRRYGEIRNTVGPAQLGPFEPLQNWIDLLASGVNPRDVKVLGIGGGLIAGFEYRLAKALGADVAVLRGSGRSADLVTNFGKLGAFPGILGLVGEEMAIRAFLMPSPVPLLNASQRKAAAQQAHESYLRKNPPQKDANSPWADLAEGYRQSNREQIDAMVLFLGEHGYSVRAAQSRRMRLPPGWEKAVPGLARREHGRWMVERIRAGWTPGTPRDNVKKIHPNLVPWADLDGATRRKDYEAVREWPHILHRAGLEIYRP